MWVALKVENHCFTPSWQTTNSAFLFVLVIDNN